MASPINNPSSTNVTTVTTSTPTTATVTTTLGDHTVSTTGSDTATATATNVNTATTPVITQTGEQTTLEEVVFSNHTVTTTTSSSAAQATATTSSSIGENIITGGQHSTTATGGSGRTASTSQEGAVGGTGGAQSQTPLEQLSNLQGSVAPEGTQRAEGPGGLPDMRLPSYDPTSKESILKFLSDPAVQAKLVTKAGHIVYRDSARGSFIFIRNGDWSSACSISVANGRTKKPITDVGDLDKCVAKFCVGYETFQNDFENNIRPKIEGKTGQTGGYDHLMLSFKFKSAVVYGPWNSKESSPGYSPSVWRRGTEVKSGEIWGDVGGFDGINWQTTQKPQLSEDGASFSNETGGPGGGAAAAPTPMAMPTININLGGVHTRVDIAGGNASAHVTSSDGQKQPTSGAAEEPIQAQQQHDLFGAGRPAGAEETGDLSQVQEGDGDIPPPPPPPPTSSGSGVAGMSLQTLNDVLRNAREHLDTVYDQNGVHHEGNQDLGTVVRTSENGTYQPTVLLNQNANSGAIQDGHNDDDSGGAAGGVSGTGTRGEDSVDGASTGNERAIDDGTTGRDSALRNILGNVRAHLDVVYQGENGEPIPTNQNLGQVIRDLENGKQPEPTKPEGVFTAKRVMITDEDPQTSDTKGTGDQGQSTVQEKSSRVSPEPTATKLMLGKGRRLPGDVPLDALLPKLRSHFDKSFDAQGNLKDTGGKSLGTVISDFKSSTGSGGLFGPMASSTVVTTPTPQQSAVSEALPSPQTATDLKAGNTGDLHQAAANVASHLSSVVQSATPPAGRTVSVPSPATQIATSTPVGGEKSASAPLSGGGSPTAIADAARSVTQNLGLVATRLRMLQAGQNLNTAIRDAEAPSTQGLQLMQAASTVAQATSQMLSQANKKA